MKFSTQNKNGVTHVPWGTIKVYVDKHKPGTKLLWEIRPAKSTESSPMRNYYFGCVIKPTLAELGYESYESAAFHERMKQLYFDIEPDELGIYQNVPSVFGKKSKLEVAEKWKFVEMVVRLVNKYGVVVDDPPERGPYAK